MLPPNLSSVAQENLERWIRAALIWLVVIVILGLSMRAFWAYQTPLPRGIMFTRHAHSHTAFWGWTGSVFFGFILALGIRAEKRLSRLESGLWWSTQLLSTFALVSFLLTGYGLVSIVLSGLLVLVWLVFIGYLLRFGAANTFPKAVWDFTRYGIGMLGLSTLPTFVLPVLMKTGWGGEWGKSVAIHFFLQAYSEGWLYLMALGLLIWMLAPSGAQLAKGSWWLSVPLILLGAFRPVLAQLPSPFQGLVLLASVVWGLMQIRIAALLWASAQGIFRLVLVWITCKGSLDTLLIVPIFTELIVSKPFTVLYLHLKLLGIVSMTLWIFIRQFYDWHTRTSIWAERSLVFGVSLTMLGLMMIASASVPVFATWGLDGASWWMRGQSVSVAGAVFVLIPSLWMTRQVFVSYEISKT